MGTACSPNRSSRDVADALRIPEHLQRRERLVTEVNSTAMEDDEEFDLDDYEVW